MLMPVWTGARDDKQLLSCLCGTSARYSLGLRFSLVSGMLALAYQLVFV